MASATVPVLTNTSVHCRGPCNYIESYLRDVLRRVRCHLESLDLPSQACRQATAHELAAREWAYALDAHDGHGLTSIRSSEEPKQTEDHHDSKRALSNSI